ncbi:MAG: transposase [Acidobacteriaceae bacterium]
MPRGLERYQEDGELHFVTFSCYRRKALLTSSEAKSTFERALERVRQFHGLRILGYVVMPEHVHLLVSEPERSKLATALQMLKQIVSHELRTRSRTPFWQTRYYDFNVWSEKKRIEKLKYMHRNPVRRGLVAKPEEWAWSSFNHYASRIEGVVRIGPG